ncbi:MAG: ACT domain-containing protein [Fusobacteriaceae bacterium]|jgi:chorismate mutase|nr:ACT domain-containing protein [Fusobacteriaceae bacterium]
MLDNYLIVDKSVLPDVFQKVVEVNRLLEEKEFLKVSEATKKVGISRSSYYKYKDYVFLPTSNMLQKKAVISFILHHKKGVLSNVLRLVLSSNCNIITINQNIPIHTKAVVTMSMDVSEMNISIEGFIRRVSEIDGVSRVNLVSVE